MTHRVPVDRTENDPDIFVQVLAEFEQDSPPQQQPRDPKGRFTKKEPNRA